MSKICLPLSVEHNGKTVLEGGMLSQAYMAWLQINTFVYDKYK